MTHSTLAQAAPKRQLSKGKSAVVSEVTPALLKTVNEGKKQIAIYKVLSFEKNL